jgi:hypothetical protein
MPEIKAIAELLDQVGPVIASLTRCASQPPLRVLAASQDYDLVVALRPRERDAI